MKENIQKTPFTPKGLVLLIPFTIVFVIIYQFIFDSKIDLSGDSLYYYFLGKALATGNGYMNTLGAIAKPENHFPPGYPFVISLAVMVGAKSVTAIKILNGFFFWGSIILFYRILIKLNVNWMLALVSAAFMALNEHLLFYSIITMSEMPFTFFTILAIHCLLSINEEKAFFKDFNFWGLVLSMILGYYIKTSGIALVFAVFVYFGFKKNWFALGTSFISFVIGALPWFIRNKQLGGNAYLKALMLKNSYHFEEGYMNLNDFIERLWLNFEKYTNVDIQNAIFPFLSRLKLEEGMSYPTSQWLGGILIYVVIVFGLIKINKKYNLVLFAFLISMYGIALSWPHIWSDVRFIIPAVPFLLFIFLNGIVEFFNTILAKMKMNAQFPAFILVILMFPVFTKVKQMNQNAKKDYEPQWKNFIELAKWCKDNTPHGEVICSRKPSIFHLFAERPVASWLDTSNDTLLLAKMEEMQVKYVVFDQLGFTSTSKYLYPAYEKNQSRFQIVQHFPEPDTYLLKFLPAKKL